MTKTLVLVALTLAASSMLTAEDIHSQPDALVLSRSVYAGTAASITVGETLPPPLVLFPKHSARRRPKPVSLTHTSISNVVVEPNANLLGAGIRVRLCSPCVAPDALLELKVLVFAPYLGVALLKSS